MFLFFGGLYNDCNSKRRKNMSKAIVTYFSATETTKGLAERLAHAIDADLFEIVPKQRYSDADLDWTKKTSRTSVEMNDPKCRPQIAKNIKDLSQYQVVFVGFPIWWYREPSIIDTFMESYDFNGVTVVPFATSGGSSIGDANKNIRKIAPNANVVSGKRFSTDETEHELKKWATQWL